jgi:hypothetical protein
MRRITRVINFIVPTLWLSLLGALGFGYRWIESRASRDDVGTAVGATTAPIEAAATHAHSASSLAKAHAAELRALWIHVIRMRAELDVYRNHGRADAPTRGRYIEQAQKFYLHAFAQQLERTTEPAVAAERALLEEWRPPR